MSVLEGMKPVRVMHYFEEICKIPHGSGNTKQISDYCVAFAKSMGLSYIQDDSNNVIIMKDGSSGREQEEPVIIQGHLDMVCEKEKDVVIDFRTEGLSLEVRDGMLTAKGTTLGGDDGIAIAYALAILESEEISHPPIEAVFTVDEEIGMLGAEAIDCTPLRGKRMLNIDSEDEGIFLVSCAGGATVSCHLPVERAKDDETGENAIFDANACVKRQLTVTGLVGGHSGMEINKGRGNANQIMGRILYAISKKLTFNLGCVNGGLKDNAIPRECVAVLYVDRKDIGALEETVKLYQKILSDEYAKTDGDVKLILEETDSIEDNCMNDDRNGNAASVMMNSDSTKRVIAALENLPGGVKKMSHDIEGLVQTSLNMGILKTKESEVLFEFSARSSVGTEKEALIASMECLMEILGGTVTCAGQYPAWEYKKDSKIRELICSVYEEQTGKQAKVEAIHAGVECGLFAGKIPELDCVAFGPNIYDIHTPKEALELASVERTWDLILTVLERI